MFIVECEIALKIAFKNCTIDNLAQQKKAVVGKLGKHKAVCTAHFNNDTCLNRHTVAREILKTTWDLDLSSYAYYFYFWMMTLFC